MKNKKLFCHIVLILLIPLLCGCGRKKVSEISSSEAVASGKMLIYYLNAEGDSLIPVETNLDFYSTKSTEELPPQEYNGEEDSTLEEPAHRDGMEETETQSFTISEANVNQLLSYLSNPMDEKYKPSITREMQVEYADYADEDLDGCGIVTVDLGNAFAELKYSTQVLCKASIVYTLCQMKEIQGVAFTMNNENYTDTKNESKTYLTPDDFVTSMDHLFQNKHHATLYYVNEKGDQFVQCEKMIEITGNESLEYAVVKALRDETGEEGCYHPLPKDLTIHSVYVNNRTCFVDVGEEILEINNGLSLEVEIYSVVNSLLALDNVDSVQFLVDGKIIQDMSEKFPVDDLFHEAMKIFEDQE